MPVKGDADDGEGGGEAEEDGQDTSHRTENLTYKTCIKEVYNYAK